MKRIITLLAMSILLVFSGYSQNQSYLMGIMKIGKINKLSAEGLQIKGKVKSIKTTNYKAVVVDGKIQKGEMSYRALRRDFDYNDDLVDPEPGIIRIRTFNKDGKVTSFKQYYWNMTIQDSVNYKWQGGLLIESYKYNKRYCDICGYDGSKSAYKTEYTYDGIMLKEELRITERLLQEIIYDYDDSPDSIYNAGSTIKTIYNTDDNGFVLGFTTYYSEDNVSNSVNTYENNRIVQKVDGVGREYITETIDYKYLNKGTVVETSTFKSGPEQYTINKCIYKKGLLRCWWSAFSKTPDVTDDYLDSKYKCELSYNKYNDVIKIKVLGKKYTFKYEYDKNHNWTKRISYKNGEPVYIEERDVEYY